MVMFALFFSLLGAASALDQLELSVTYRGVLPAQCYFFAFENTTSDEAVALKQQELDAWLTEGGFSNTAVVPTNVTSCNAILALPEWRTLFQEGNIKGHPDFESAGQRVTRNLQCNAFEGAFPFGFCDPAETGFDDLIIIGEDLTFGSNGLGKPTYCKSGQEDRCGFMRLNAAPTNNFQAQSQKKFFDSWYNDDLTFNRRIGQKLILTREEGTNLFTFDSNLDSDAPEIANVSMFPGFFAPLSHLNVDPEENIQNLELSKFWPPTVPGTLKRNHFTTEIHTTFEFREDLDMTFTFSGDDDLWVFVNGKMAIDLGGAHARITATVDLLAPVPGANVTVADKLELQNGTVYTLDIFHAERQREGSNFKIQTSLIPRCDVRESGTKRIDVSSPDFDDALINSDRVERSGEILHFPSGSSFWITESPIDLKQGFKVNFDLSVPPGENLINIQGIAFVLFSDASFDLQNLGGAFNFEGLPTSVAVAFDLCSTFEIDLNQNFVCSSKSVSVHYPDSPASPNEFSEATFRNAESIHLKNLERNESLAVEISYLGGNPDFLEIYIEGSLFVRVSDFKIEDIIDKSNAFIGFTTSNEVSGLEISNFALTMLDLDVQNTVFSSDEHLVIFADGLDSANFEIRTQDSCGNLIFDVNSVENLQTLVVQGNRLESVLTLNDEGSGVYSFQFSTADVGNYDLIISFGPDCALDIASGFVEEFEKEGCFRRRVTDAVFARSITPTSSPTNAPTPQICPGNLDLGLKRRLTPLGPL